MTDKIDVLLIGPPKPVVVDGLARAFNLVKFSDVPDQEKFFAETAPHIRAILSQHGYRLTGLRAFDLFPMTHHVECVALLVRPALTRGGAILGLG